MSPHSIAWNTAPWDRNLVFPRAEQLFQALRFPPEHPILADMLRITNPMAAKMKVKTARDDMVIKPTSPEDVENMRRVLWAKYRQHGEIRELLKSTGNLTIAEDCTRRVHGAGLFWGMACLPDGSWTGGNQLGKLWMEIRGTTMDSCNNP